MRKMRSRHGAALLLLASAGLGEGDARAGVDTSVVAYPPDGWPHLCSGHSIDVKPSLTRRTYTGTGTCWINTAQNKSDGNQQNWVRAAVTLEGDYRLQGSSFAEKLTVSLPPSVPTTNGTVIVTTSGTCADDPWATGAQCGISTPNVNLQASFGWSLQPPNGPLSRNVFGSALVAALLKKESSKPPLAPVDLDAVRWPAFDGGTEGRVFWRAPDVSGNRWILAYDVEYANSPDSAFIKAGHVTGPGAKSNLSPNEVSRFFYTTFKLGGADYYFRVCAANDAGQQCSGAVRAREPTKQELMVLSHHQSKVTMAIGGSPPAGSSPPRVAAPPAQVRIAPAVRPPR
jgi:hypothetical protein